MKRILFLLPICLAAVLVRAQNSQDKKVYTLGHTESLDSLTMAESFANNAPGDFPVEAVPGAVYVGKDNKFILGVGGFVKVITGVDFGHPIDNADEFITSQIPMMPMDGDGMRYNLSAKQTHIYLNFVALPGSQDEVGAFVSANLLDDYIPSVQYAYLRYRGLKAGYDNTLFSDPACGAPSVDYEGPCSNTASPVAGISYMWSPKKNRRWQLGGGIELPQSSFTTVDGRTRSVYQRVPDIPVAVKYGWDDGDSWIRLSGIFRTLTYREKLESKNYNKFGYGFQLSGAWCFLDRFTFFYQGLWGKGIASLVQDTADEGLDLVPDDGGKFLTAPMVWGGFLALQYEITPQIISSITYSQVRSYAQEYTGGTTPWPDLYKYTQYVNANIFYQPKPYFEIGLENIWGRRTNHDGMKCADNRLQVSFQFTF